MITLSVSSLILVFPKSREKRLKKQSNELSYQNADFTLQSQCATDCCLYISALAQVWDPILTHVNNDSEWAYDCSKFGTYTISSAILHSFYARVSESSSPSIETEADDIRASWLIRDSNQVQQSVHCTSLTFGGWDGKYYVCSLRICFLCQ